MLNTAEPGEINASHAIRPSTAGVPPERAARNPGDAVKEGNIGSVRSLDAATRNTAGPEETNSTGRPVQ